MEAARQRGAQILGGLPMLVYQGAASFEIWTGKEAPVDIMFNAVREATGVSACEGRAVAWSGRFSGSLFWCSSWPTSSCRGRARRWPGVRLRARAT